jgi:hypothetical protein
MSKRRAVMPRNMPVMTGRCKTCPFNANGNIELRTRISLRILTDSSQTCHSTGVVFGRADTHLCRGARDLQLTVLHRIGFLPAPTDEAWAEKLNELEPHKRE